MLEDALARGWENLIGRWGGPMSFRCVIQPTVAILFAIRAGLKDARQHETPFLWAVFSIPGTRLQRFRQVWTDVGTVFVVALILDAIYQVIVLASVFPLELLIAAAVLALVPYVVSRGLVTRVAKWAGIGEQSVVTSTNGTVSEKSFNQHPTSKGT